MSSVQQLVQMDGCLTSELTCPRTFRRLSMGISTHECHMADNSALIGVLLTIHREPHFLINNEAADLYYLTEHWQPKHFRPAACTLTSAAVVNRPRPAAVL